MATIVLVHGINHHRETADGIEATWLPALAGGVRLAGRDDLADRLWPPRSRPDAIAVRAAYYGDAFRAPDRPVRGPEALSPPRAGLAEAIAAEWLGRLDPGAPPPAVARTRGGGDRLRATLCALASRAPAWLASGGMAVAERFFRTELAQVTRYLTEPALRAAAQQAVLDRIDAGTRILIGHSLGSVVAYECAHRLEHRLPLLVTLGSPLGLRSIVTERLSPPPAFPARVAHWLNLANLEDLVAAEPDLWPLFAGDGPGPGRFTGLRFREPGPDPHRAETYLGRRAVGAAVIAGLDAAGSVPTPGPATVRSRR